MTIKEMSFKYDKANIAVNDISLKLAKGEWTSVMVVIMGAGKN